MENQRLRFERTGPAAVRAGVLGMMFDMAAPTGVQSSDGVATVSIVGPLCTNVGWFDSYEAIRARVAEAVALPDVQVVELRINSPGGDAFGAFDTARAIRLMCAGAGKSLIAVVEGEACSAAYALACAAEKIFASSTALVGSIGVITQIVSFARGDAAAIEAGNGGAECVVVTSGKNKANGNPNVPISPEAISASQQMVDDLALEFFAWVKEARGIDAQPLEASTFVGARAVAVGLADGVGSPLDLRAMLTESNQSADISATAARGRRMASTNEKASAVKAGKYGEAAAKLFDLAEEGDEKAKKALKALLAEDSDSDKDDDGKKDDKGAKKAESEGDKGDDEKKDDKKDAKALSSAELVDAVVARIEASSKRAAILASRPDLAADEALQSVLASTPVEKLPAILSRIPNPAAAGSKEGLTPPAQPTASTAGKTAGQSASVAGDPSRLPASVRAAMGLETAYQTRVVHAPGVSVFGGTDEQVQEAIARRHGKAG